MTYLLLLTFVVLAYCLYKQPENFRFIEIATKIVRTEPVIPTMDEVKNSYTNCLSNGNPIKDCLSNSGAGLYPEICRELCDMAYGPRNLYCGKVCGQMMSQQRDSCSAGLC